MTEGKRPEYSCFPLDMYEAGLSLTDTQRAKLYGALLALFFDGTEPERLPRAAEPLFAAFRERVLRARSRALSKSEGAERHETAEAPRISLVTGEPIPSGRATACALDSAQIAGAIRLETDDSSAENRRKPDRNPNATDRPLDEIGSSGEGSTSPLAAMPCGSINREGTYKEKKNKKREVIAASAAPPLAGALGVADDEPLSVAGVMAFAREKSLTFMVSESDASAFIAKFEKAGWRDQDGLPMGWRQAAGVYQRMRQASALGAADGANRERTARG